MRMPAQEFAKMLGAPPRAKVAAPFPVAKAAAVTLEPSLTVQEQLEE